MREPPVFLGALPAGGTVAVQPLPAARSVHLGVLLRAGACHEADADSGLSHFLEHMVFKGGRRHDAFGVAREIEALGGRFDAYTTHDLTAYTLQVLPANLDRGLELLAELILEHPVDPALLATERQVVIEEILEAEDTPADLVQELCAATAWPGHPLGRSVLGSVEHVARFTAGQVTRHRARFYTRSRFHLIAAGDVRPEALVEAATAAFAELPPGTDEPDPPAPVWTPGLTTRRMDVDQIYLCLAAPGLPVGGSGQLTLALLDALLGGTMSSRLFQEVRERRGLCYQITSSCESLRSAGMLTIEAVANPKQIGELLRVVRDELASLATNGVSEADLAWVKDYYRTTVILGTESAGSRHARLARNIFYHGKHRSVSRVLASLEAVTARSVQTLAARLFQPGGLVLGAVGPVTDKRAARWWEVVAG